MLINPGTLGRVLKPTEVHVLLPFRPLLRHFPLTCPGTPAENFLAWNENSAKLASFRVFRHALVKYRASLMASASLLPSTASANDQEKPYFGIFGLWKILTIPKDAILLKPA